MQPTNVGSYEILKKSLQQTRLHRWRGHSALGFSALALALPLLFAALPAGADTSFTTTNWVAGVPVPGIQYTNSSGLVYLKGNVHIHRVLSSDARIAGRLTAWMDLAYQADGTALLVGPAYVEPGNWDATGTNFTPSGGVWNLKYTGVAQADGSDVVHFVGYGIGGTIEGLRMECTATKGPGARFDPTVPYVASGTIKPAPINSSLIVDDFEDGDWPAWDDPGGGTRMPSFSETGGRFTIHCDWTGVSTINPFNTLAWVGHDRAWTVPNAQTLELRADLVDLNPAADCAVLAFAVQPGGPNFILLKGHTWLMLLKQNQVAIAALCGDKVTTPDTGVVMSLALTGGSTNLVLTARVFDKAEPRIVLYERTYLDTPASDAVLSSQQIAALIGGSVPGFGSDPGPAWKSGQRVWLGVWQLTDGTKPPAEAAFDNVELRTYEVPQVGIERAVQLSWPDTGMNFTVEAAPTLQGPWLPVLNSAPPGCQQKTVPQSGPMQFFRLQQAP